MLNQRAIQLADAMIADADELRIELRDDGGAARVVDVGIDASGGLEAGRRLTEICLAGLGRVAIVPAHQELWNGPAVTVATDHPVAACMASQYAGWKLARDDFYAMGSGPMRAAAGVEEIFSKIGFDEQADIAVGVLETRHFPPEPVIDEIATKCRIDPARLTLFVAPTASQAGTIQIAGRSVETAPS